MSKKALCLQEAASAQKMADDPRNLPLSKRLLDAPMKWRAIAVIFHQDDDETWLRAAERSSLQALFNEIVIKS